MRKALITGANGQLGSRLSELALSNGDPVIVCDRTKLDITDPTSIEQALSKHRPQVVINAAAYTAVDQAEEEVEKAYAVNAVGTEHLARECANSSIDMIHISTDYVFSGNQS